jgi:hypothetical protein
MLLRYHHINPHIHKHLLTRSSYATMGNAQSQAQRPPFRPTSNGVYDGPFFGGHHAGDFSLAVCPPLFLFRSLTLDPLDVRVISGLDNDVLIYRDNPL